VATRSSPITVGRDVELGRIEDALARATSGRPQIVIVRGEAGIGKTRLIGEAVDRARAAGSPILHGGCLDLEGEGLPYLPLVEALRSFVRTVPADRALELLGPAQADLGALVPEIAGLGRGGPASVGLEGLADRAAAAREETPVDRARLFERILGFLARLGSEEPVLAVVEDVQWIDPATHDLITFLVRNVTTERLVAVITCRTDDLPPGHPVLGWLAELSRAPGAVRLDLGRLSRDDVERQLTALGGGPVPRETVTSIWRRSEGHPLFAEELFAAADETGGEAPPSLVDVLLTRVARLDDATLTVVGALAVAGGPIDERLLGPLVDQTAAEIATALRGATAAGVLSPLADGRYAFRHELLREIVEDGLTPGERRALHAGFARELEAHPELADERPAAATAELARHWAGADEPVEAYHAAVAAAVAAEDVHAFGDAHRQLERAIALEPRLPKDARPSVEDRIDVRRRAATDADLTGAADRARELILEALRDADEHADARTQGWLHARLAFLTWAAGDGEGALAEHRLAVDLVPEEPPSKERAAVLGGLGGALMGFGRWAESQEVCEAAIDCATRCGAVAEESRARTILGSDLVALGDHEAGLDHLREAHKLAGPEPTEMWVVTGHNLGVNLLATDHVDEALAVATSTAAGVQAGGLERRYGMELAALVGDALTRLGRWDEADQVTTAGIALDQAGRGTPYLAVVRARLVARRGDVDAGRALLAAIDRDQFDLDFAVLHAIVAAEIQLLGGRPSEALGAVEDVLDRFVESGDVLWGVPLIAVGLRAAAEQAEVLRAARDDTALDAVQARSKRLREVALELGKRELTPSATASLATAMAEQSRLDAEVDPTPWAAAVRAWDAAKDPAEAAYARYRLAETSLRQAGIKADVAAEVQAAWRAAVRLRSAWLERQIVTLAKRARIVLREQPVEEPGEAAAASGGAASAAAMGPGRPAAGHDRAAAHTLSAREIEVLRLVAAGRSNGEIGEELFITRKTAGVHVTHILDKLGVTNRVEAAMAAARLGLLEPEPDETRERVG
jgi:ATP/maltotriose-dependent transcriptional regulator MalT